MLSNSNDLLFEVSSVGVSAIKPLIYIDNLTVYGIGIFEQDIGCDMFIVTDNIRAKTQNAITIHDDIIINGSITITKNMYCEFVASANSLGFTNVVVTLPLNTTKYYTSEFTLEANGEITINASMLASIILNLL